MAISCIKRVRLNKQAMGLEPENSPYASCFGSCLQVPALSSCPDFPSRWTVSYKMML
ncbi:rCG26762 [Rattus norvegicus]|uniref:RCG26762 n=1 Tax=Rattus norvegicus TaxID=10116 RepID=A6HMJ2_RAT|nr:rCG26762 [Rattus norvegicus]